MRIPHADFIHNLHISELEFLRFGIPISPAFEVLGLLMRLGPFEHCLAFYMKRF